MEQTNSNKVIFIIAVIIVIFVTLIAILYANKVKPKKVEPTNYDIKVYKSHEDTNTESGHSYGACEVDPSNKPLLIAEFKNINNLNDNNIITNTSINGTYRIDYNGDLIAFDDNSGIVYVGSKDSLYYYNSTIYDKVMEYCK